MGLVIWLIAGCAIGWVASLFMRTSMRQPVWPYLAVAGVGAVLGGSIVATLVGVEAIKPGDWSLATVLVAMAGAVVLLGLVQLFHHGSERWASAFGARRNLPKESA